MTIEKKDFGKTKDGKACSLYTLTNKNGMSVSLTDFGATIVSVIVPDKDGNMKDVVLGYDDVTGFEEGGCFFGAVIGRSGNRIQNGRREERRRFLTQRRRHGAGISRKLFRLCHLYA